MRYWICTLILVFVSTGIGNSQIFSAAPYKSLSVDSDCDLPDSTKWYSVQGFNIVEYSFSFDFTDVPGITVIYYGIDSTDVHRIVDSDDYVGDQQVQQGGFGSVVGDSNRMYIDIDTTYNSCGHFYDMLFQAWYSVQ